MSNNIQQALAGKPAVQQTCGSVIEDCLINVHLVLYCIEHLGWMKAFHVLLLQEVLRLATCLQLVSDLQQREQLKLARERLEQILQSLKKEKLYAWPLVVVRIKRILISTMANSSQATPSEALSVAQQRFHDLCRLILTYQDKLADQHLHGLTSQTFLSTLTCEQLIQRVWQHSLTHAFLFDSSGVQNAVGPVWQSQQIGSAFVCFLMPRAGTITDYAWSLLQITDAHEIQCDGDSVSLLALQQILMQAQPQEGLQSPAHYLLVSVSSNCCRLVLPKGADVRFSRKLLQDISKFLPHIHLSHVWKSQPKELHDLDSQESQESSILPIHAPSTSYQLAPQKFRHKSGNISPQVRLIISSHFEASGYLMHLSSKLAAAFLQRTQKSSQPIYLLLQVNTMNEVFSLLQDTALDDVDQTSKQQHRVIVLPVALLLSQGLNLTNILNRLADISSFDFGLYSQTPQDISALHHVQDTIFSTLILAPAWFEQLDNQEVTLRGNDESRLRHLAQQGWQLLADQVGDYHIAAGVARLGLAGIVCQPSLASDVLSQTIIEH